MVEWTKETQADTMLRMEFHLQKMDEGIKMLEEVGLDLVAKKLRNAHKMMVKDLNERWVTDTPKKTIIILDNDHGGTVDNGWLPEDIIKELQKQAKRNSDVMRF